MEGKDKILDRRKKLREHLEGIMEGADAINSIMAQLPHDGAMGGAQVNLVANGSEFIYHDPEGVNAVYKHHNGKSYEIRVEEIR